MLSYLEAESAEIYQLPVLTRFAGRHLELLTSVTSGCIRNSATEFLDYENVVVAVGTAFLSCLEADI